MLELRDQWIEIIGSGVKVNQKDLNHLKTILEENIGNVINNHLNALSEIFPDKEFRSLEKAFDFLINNQESLASNDQKSHRLKETLSIRICGKRPPTCSPRIMANGERGYLLMREYLPLKQL